MTSIPKNMRALVIQEHVSQVSSAHLQMLKGTTGQGERSRPTGADASAKGCARKGRLCGECKSSSVSLLSPRTPPTTSTFRFWAIPIRFPVVTFPESSYPSAPRPLYCRSVTEYAAPSTAANTRIGEPMPSISESKRK